MLSGVINQSLILSAYEGGAEGLGSSAAAAARAALPRSVR